MKKIYLALSAVVVISIILIGVSSINNRNAELRNKKVIIQECENHRRLSKDMVDSCYVLKAQNSKQSELCLSILNSNTKAFCQAQISLDPKFCAEIADSAKPGFDKDACYDEVGIYSKNTAVCDKISRQEKKNHCYQNIVSQTGDKSICDKIIDTGLNEKVICEQIAADTNLHMPTNTLIEEGN